MPVKEQQKQKARCWEFVKETSGKCRYNMQKLQILELLPHKVISYVM